MWMMYEKGYGFIKIGKRKGILFYERGPFIGGRVLWI